MPNSFGSLQKLNGTVAYHSLPAVGHALGVELGRMPVALKVLLENLVRHEDGVTVTPDDIAALARWPDPVALGREVAFHPVRVLMPDSSGVPLLIDLAAMRDVMAARGLDPRRVDPSVATDLVIDHSVRVDFAGTPDAYARNVHAELERNRERYGVVKWAMGQFRNLRVVPPGNGIVHQVNIEHFAQVVACAERDGHTMAFPDSLVGMDSHTTMVNALAVFGWGVGGIEAATAMFGQPVGLPTPRVVGCRLIGTPRPGVMCTDIVLAITRLLRGADVLAAVVEFCGPALDHLSLPDRATIANMAPEYGATMGFFPIDAETLRYLRQTGRADAHVALVEQYAKAQGLWRAQEPAFQTVLEFDLGSVQPSLAGPSRPESLVARGGRTAAVSHHLRRPRHGRPAGAFGHRRNAPVAARRRRHCRDRVLHQHGESVSDDCGRLARAQRRREGTARQALGEDLVLPRLARRAGHAGQGGPRPGAERSRLPSRRLRLHELRQRLRCARPGDRRRNRRARAGGGRRDLQQPEF